MRKIIERAFGVLQIKFACLKQPCRKHSIDDAEEMMLTCMLLHNMMVEYRIENGEDEDFTNYNIVANGLFNAPPTPPAPDHIGGQVDLHFAGRAAELPADVAENIEVLRNSFPEHWRTAIEARWAHLYNRDEHKRLLECVQTELVNNGRI